jgi:hypothetical protein
MASNHGRYAAATLKFHFQDPKSRALIVYLMSWGMPVRAVPLLVFSLIRIILRLYYELQI